MLTRLHIRNFKCFDEVDVELGRAVVLIGPNNSGKTTALQALALWEIGVRRWNEKRKGKPSPEKRPGVTINRNDLTSIPVPDANLLWRDLHVRNVEQVWSDEKKKKVPKTANVRIEITVEGVSADRAWSCGLEFDYANEESFYCRPLRTGGDDSSRRMGVPEEVADVRVAYLPPMSGLAANEPKSDPGRINFLIGQGETAQVLRNLCFLIHSHAEPESNWDTLVEHIQRLFGVVLLPPRYIAERGEITMAYKERSGTRLDLSCSGRGLQQTLLLLAHMYENPQSVLLLDEPDAHLEILRQRQIYRLLTDVARERGSQIVAASHSEVVLNEAADRDIVVAFVGKPHRIDNGGSQVLKALRDIGFDHYYQAEQVGWVLYLEGPSDLAILQAFARTLGHEATDHLERPFVQFVGTNLPQKARDHFYGLREAKKDFIGLALFDRLDKQLQDGQPLVELMWRCCEIENYFCQRDVLLDYARHGLEGSLFQVKHERAMNEAISQVGGALKTLGKDPWSVDIKASDEFLHPLFRSYFKALGLPNLFKKSDYHVLAGLVPADRIDPEVVEKLDAIVDVASRAKPRT